MIRRHWKYVLGNDFQYNFLEVCQTAPGDVCEFACQNAGELRGRIYPEGIIEVLAGYAWDGCSPKYRVGDLFVVGIPDGVIDPMTGWPMAALPALVHDFLYQFHKDPHMPLTLKEIDLIFYHMLEAAGFWPRLAYYYAVRINSKWLA